MSPINCAWRPHSCLDSITFTGQPTILVCRKAPTTDSTSTVFIHSSPMYYPERSCMEIIRVIVSFVCLLVSLGADAQSSAAGNTLRFTAIPDQNTTELTEKFQPFADYLGKQLSMKVEYVPARDYQATVEMFRNGDVQLAWFGGLTGVQARKAVPGARAIAQGKEDPQYYSYFVAHKDTGLTESESFPQAIASMTFT